MNFQADINIQTQSQILDPQGKVVTASLHKLGMENIQNVRIGKNITLQIVANSKEEATKEVDEACQKLLANLIMETYTFSIMEV